MMIVMTIGHSTHTSKEFIQVLKAHRVQRLVDVRTVPRSRHNPQFNRSELSRALHSSHQLAGVVEVLKKPKTPEWKPVVERVRAIRRIGG